jgi:hypothetical protein
MYAPHSELEKSRQGSYNYRDRWYLYDWMMTSPAIARSSTLKIAGVGIYAREYLTSSTLVGMRRPHRTFYAGEYLAGFSDHFPVYITLVK